MNGKGDAGPGGVRSGTLSAADWLSLAAAPSFALMAVLTAVQGQDLICVGGGHGFLFGGMVPMYGLMSIFHAAPWLRLIGRR